MDRDSVNNDNPIPMVVNPRATTMDLWDMKQTVCPLDSWNTFVITHHKATMVAGVLFILLYSCTVTYSTTRGHYIPEGTFITATTVIMEMVKGYKD
jgi:hypothetical protein